MPRPVCARALAAALVSVVAMLAACKHEAAGYGEIVQAESLGDTYLESNDLPRAADAYKRFASLAPSSAAARMKLGIVYTRMNRPDDAEDAFREASALDTASVDARLLLASALAANGHRDQARSVLEALGSRTPPDPKAFFALAALARSNPDSARGRTDERAALEKLVAADPASRPAHLALAQSLARAGDADGALRELEALEQIPPTPFPDARRSLTRAMTALRARDLVTATGALADLERSLDVTLDYQAALETLRGPQVTVAGLPNLSLPTTESMRERLRRASFASPDTSVAFTALGQAFPAVKPAGGGAFALAVGDYDGDGSDDFFISAGSAGRAMLVHWEQGQWVDAAAPARVSVTGATAATFADFDDDGRLDRCAVDGAGRGSLFMNDGNGHFRDATARSGLARVPAATRVVAVDLDHEGDIDLVLATTGGLRFFRNNGDGTFVDATALAGLSRPGDVADVAFGDLDDDGMLDLAAIGGGGASLFHNDRQRRLDERAAAAGLEAARGNAIAIGDYDNDGFLDLFAGDRLYRNSGDGHFAPDARATALAQPAAAVRDAQFVDYDNDGRLDLVLATGQGLRLFHNDGSGRFSNRSALLPKFDGPARLARSDVDRDRDMDLLVLGDAGLEVLRNDGGNRNLAVQVSLKGLTTGSGKNNALGLGATLTVRVGDQLQRRTVTERVTTIGLGPHLKADVVRIQWPNGVPQTIYYPGSDQDVIENQVLKSSCGFLYAWNGSRYEFTTDIMWRSALGMPVGIGGNGDANFAPAAASKEYLKIPRGALVADGGRYRVQLTEELWETSYTDELTLVAVDHPDSVDMVVDERFVPPGPPVSLDLFATRRVRPPAAAVDDRGNDLMPSLRDADFVFASGLERDRFQGVTAPHDLVIDLGPDLGEGQLLLMLRGWVFPTDASINVALSQGKATQVAWPELDVKDARGRWVPAVKDLSIPSGKNKLVVVDLTGKIPGADHRVRIRTNVQIYWDQASVATTAPAAPRTVTPLRPVKADLHYRGFSQLYRKGGRYGPHWFDYAAVSTEPAWLPIEGNFTRYGDVLPLLQASDDEYIVMAPGDETTIEFDAGALPPLAPGWTRDFFVYSDGWIKDGDLNTAHGGTVGPLPFHAMTRYPYARGEAYPAGAHRAFLDKYQTRVVGPRASAGARGK
jgi:cytochrome c-type biogenesis protein CcmH/NrfG